MERRLAENQLGGPKKQQSVKEAQAYGEEATGKLLNARQKCYLVRFGGGRGGKGVRKTVVRTQR